MVESKEQSNMKRIIWMIALVISLAPLTLAQQTTMTGHDEKKTAADMRISSPAEIAWQNGPASLPAGGKMAVLEGDPGKEDFFTMRLWLPDGFKISPHFHPKVEHVTVISGTFNFGMGDKFDQTATRAMPAGTFGFWPAEMKHFAWAKGETIIQLHGIGPWMITYVNPSDDPRKPKQ
jgi:quercetin dioxygenase-like cupin family protein